MKSSLAVLFVVLIVGFACKTTDPPSPAPPVSPPPPPPNSPPVAVPGGPYTTTTDTIRVDGSQSSDPDAGDVLTYHWTFGDGTTGDSMKMTHVYQRNGDYPIALVVTDRKGAKDTGTTHADVAMEQADVLVGAGNIASCGLETDNKTAQIIDTIPGMVFTTGDNVFDDGSESNYASCYGPSWGRFRSRTHPTLGNHEYNDGKSNNANGSFEYFGDRLPTPGYYSYEVGSWHVIVLNDKGDTDPNNHGIDAAQMEWLKGDLAAHNNKCTIAMFHVALFISSNVPDWTSNQAHRPIWDALYAAGVDIVLNGQQHNYERFAPMKPDGTLDADNGIREFNVGTGGAGLDNFTVSIHPHSETRAAVYGVLKLTLKSSSYDWKFISIPGSQFTDSGTGSCH